MARKVIFIPSSSVAACVGKNPYKTAQEAHMQLLKKLSPDAYTKKRDETGYEDDATIYRKAMAGQAPVLREVEAIARGTSDASGVEVSLEACLRRVADAVPDMAPHVHESVERVLRSAAQMSVGVKREKDVLDKVNERAEAEGMRFAKDNKLVSKEMGRVRDWTWHLCGRVDGLSEDGEVVLEIKNRMRRLFGRVVDYERVQMLCYQHLLGVQKGMLAECFQDDMCIHWVEYDEHEWDDICDRLAAFVEGLVDDLEGGKNNVA